MTNLKDMNINMEKITFTKDDQEALKAFLVFGLTDARVVNESAPFDHPEIFIPEAEKYIIIPAIGEKGRSYEGLPPLHGFFEK